jgi:two-component system, NtrC family, sensor histidine kinase HydH
MDQAAPPAITFFERIKDYVRFTEEDSAALLEILPAVQPHFGPIIDDFYDAILTHDDASRSITGGPEQVARLKQTLTDWLLELVSGPHDEAYFLKRARIGRMHVRIGLAQEYMFTAMNRIRVRLLSVVYGHLMPWPEKCHATSRAFEKILDLELAIMLETYRESLLSANRAAERLATIGQFAAGIGHELRNPLGVVESSVFLLRQRLGPQAEGGGDPKVMKHIDRIGNEVKRANKTITDLLELARNRAPTREAMSAKSLVDLGASTANLPETIAINHDVDPDLNVLVDAGQMSQVFSNLFINASQAMNGKGTIHIKTRPIAGKVEFRITDEGPGVPLDVVHRIFEPLFTTKAKGTGIGLSLCRRIMEAHEGTIALVPRRKQTESNLDAEARGATFVVVV